MNIHVSNPAPNLKPDFQFLSPIQREILIEDEYERRIYASLFRTLERAPIENRTIFQMAVHFAAEQLEARRQQAIDDLRAVATDAGLVKLLGATTVENALGTEFGGSR